MRVRTLRSRRWLVGRPRGAARRGGVPGMALAAAGALAVSVVAAVTAAVAAAAAAAVAPVGEEAPSPVTAELVIPPAATWVAGDRVPLYWRFRNTSAEPLAFMWEGCCRLNGRLQVAVSNQPLAVLPPGQALAHMFAKAERLEPGTARDYDTWLGDWVRLTETATYRLQGRYTGVLPDQQPQVGRHLKLWREAATTPPIEVDLLSVADYLAQREARSRARGLSVEFSGPATLPPLREVPYRLSVRNARGVPQMLTWPDAVQLWVLGPDGQRLPYVATGFDGSFERITVPAHGAWERELRLSSDRFEGEPWGDYRLFVDLADGGPDQPRVPSAPIPLRWTLGEPEVRELVASAAQGPKAGLRNAPLKLLRVYLSECAPALAALDPADLEPSAVALAQQLRLAAALKPVAPRPGRVSVVVWLNERGAGVFAEPTFETVLAGQGPAVDTKLMALLAVRRHLGWEIGLTLRPQPSVKVAEVAAVARSLEPWRLELAEPIRVGEPARTNAIVGAFQFPATPAPAHLVVRLGQGAAGTTLAWTTGAARAAGAVSDGRSGTTGGMLAPRDWTGGPYETGDSNGLARVAEGLVGTAPQIAAMADGSLPWAEVERHLGRLCAQGFVVQMQATVPDAHP